MDLVMNSLEEASRNNSPNAPRKNTKVKRPRLEVSSSPPVPILGNNQPSSSEGADEMWTSFVLAQQKQEFAWHRHTHCRQAHRRGRLELEHTH
ncbi:hypothetical protein L195_g060233, partial [Trifolium pratense]